MWRLYHVWKPQTWQYWRKKHLQNLWYLESSCWKGKSYKDVIKRGHWTWMNSFKSIFFQRHAKGNNAPQNTWCKTTVFTKSLFPFKKALLLWESFPKTKVSCQNLVSKCWRWSQYICKSHSKCSIPRYKTFYILVR